MTQQIAAVGALPWQRQLGLLAGTAVVIAIGATLLLWGLRPTYQPLLPGLAEAEKAQAIEALQRGGIEARLDPRDGTLTVPRNDVHRARLQLATEGLPKSEEAGFELLEKDLGMGTSRLVETARYQRALEGELARSVRTVQGVQGARVHLALPRRSTFVRERVAPSASVLVDLHPGRLLGDAQVAGIVHLVASSIPELVPERVTVVDQRGRLLSRLGDEDGAALPIRQLDYQRKVEQALRGRVQEILSPVLGEDDFQVEVTASMDFTQVESTRELFDNDGLTLRSEQLVETLRASAGPSGVPGALSNQPPAGAVVADAAAADGTTQDADQARAAGDRDRRSTRNYEVDRTIERIQRAAGQLERLSVAVVVNDRVVTAADGTVSREPRSAEELAHLSELVSEAIGLNEARGDSLSLVNASFREPQPVPEVPEAPIWEQGWFHELVRQSLAALGALLLILLVLRPAFKQLASVPAMPRRVPAAASGGSIGHDDTGRGLPDGRDGALHAGPMERRGPGMEARLTQARSLAKEDPRVVAQVVRKWMDNDG